MPVKTFETLVKNSIAVRVFRICSSEVSLVTLSIVFNWFAQCILQIHSIYLSWKHFSVMLIVLDCGLRTLASKMALPLPSPHLQMLHTKHWLDMATLVRLRIHCIHNILVYLIFYNNAREIISLVHQVDISNCDDHSQKTKHFRWIPCHSPLEMMTTITAVGWCLTQNNGIMERLRETTPID